MPLCARPCSWSGDPQAGQPRPQHSWTYIPVERKARKHAAPSILRDTSLRLVSHFPLWHLLCYLLLHFGCFLFLDLFYSKTHQKISIPTLIYIRSLSSHNFLTVSSPELPPPNETTLARSPVASSWLSAVARPQASLPCLLSRVWPGWLLLPPGMPLQPVFSTLSWFSLCHWLLFFSLLCCSSSSTLWSCDIGVPQGFSPALTSFMVWKPSIPSVQLRLPMLYRQPRPCLRHLNSYVYHLLNIPVWMSGRHVDLV